jgi:hypothetical protein
MGPAQDRVHAGLELDRLDGCHQHLVRAAVQKLRGVGLRCGSRGGSTTGLAHPAAAQRRDPVGHAGTRRPEGSRGRGCPDGSAGTGRGRRKASSTGRARILPARSSVRRPVRRSSRGSCTYICISFGPNVSRFLRLCMTTHTILRVGYMNKVKNSKYREGAKRTRRRGSMARTQAAAPTGGSRRRPAHMLLKSALILLADPCRSGSALRRVHAPTSRAFPCRCHRDPKSGLRISQRSMASAKTSSWATDLWSA